MPDIGFLIQIFLRRLHYILFISLPVTILGVWLAVNLPPSYTAQARLLVESPQVPDELAASTLRIETTEILRVLEQRMLARSNMLALSRQFGLHADEPDLTADEIVEDMRSRITMNLPHPRDPAAFVRLSFDASAPEVSANVVGELVTQLTRDYAALRTSSTRQTSIFFDGEVERLQQELDAQRARILTFQEDNLETLPDSLAYRRARQTALQERLVQVDRDLDRLSERRAQMVALFEQTGQIPSGTQALSPEQAELLSLRRELRQARSIFAAEHPRLTALERQIAALEGTTEADDVTTPLTGLFDIQLADLDGEAAFLARQKQVIEAELESLAQSISATPGNAVAFSAMQQELENIQNQYDRAVARRAEARIGERVEAQSQGRRLTVVEPPIAPSAPTKPNRRLIAASSLAAGLALGVLVVGLIELLNPAVRRPIEITRAMGIAPFATLPLMRTRRQVLLRRTAFAAMMVLAIGAVPAGLWTIDRYYAPLDTIMDQMANRSGLNALRAMFRGTS